MKSPVSILLYSIDIATTPLGLNAAGDLSIEEAETLAFMREEEKLARDVYMEMNGLWQHKIFANIAESEQRHMDSMLKMILLYEQVDPVGENPRGVFTDTFLADLYVRLVDQGAESLVRALHAGAEIEEIDMVDLSNAITETNEDALKRAYSNLLAGSCNHLRSFVSHIVSLEGTYEIKWMNESTFYNCVGNLETMPISDGAFAINSGLNDAWYFPGTTGQGFTITVYPTLQRVFLLWFTFDTVQPETDVSAGLGNAGQRWLAAQGSFEGSVAELELYSMSGGLFDDSESVAEPDFIGSIRLHFENCDSGTVNYLIPAMGLEGEIPIQRIAADNVGRCLLSE